MKLLKLGHTGITVKNLEKSIEFYNGVLGLKVVNEPCPMNWDEEESKGLGIPEGAHRICLLTTLDGQFVELMEFGGPNTESPKPTPMPLKQLGQHHISLYVENIHGCVEELKDTGVEFLYHPLPYEGEFWVLLKDPDGIIIELMGK